MNNKKLQWTDNEYNKALKVFSTWEKENLILTYGKRDKNEEYTYGLPYTSSSNFAMISNTNVEAVLKTDNQYYFNWIALDNNNNVIAGFTDIEENEKELIIGRV